LINKYKSKTKNIIYNFIIYDYNFLETILFQKYLFENYLYKKLYKNSSFNIQYLKKNDNIIIIEIIKKNIIEYKNNFYIILENIHKDYYNKLKLKSNISIDSFI